VRGRRAVLGLLLAASGCDLGLAEGGGGPEVVDSASCGACHAEQYAAWEASPHGRSSASPVFRALVAEVRDRWGDAVARRCEGCHAPGHDGSDRIGCVSCHLAVGHRGSRDGLVVLDRDAPLAGPSGRAASSAAHAVRSGAFLASAELCGTCHEVTGPHPFVERTLTEFLDSPQARGGETCVTCHLPRDALGRVDHRLTSLTPSWGAPQAVGAARRADAVRLLAGALRLELTRATPEAPLRVSLTNVGAAHDVPTGATLVRELWVEVRGLEGAPARPIALGARMSADGEAVPLPTEADDIVVDALGPGETVSRRVTVAPPVEAILYARAVREDSARALGFDPDARELAPLEVARVRAE